VLAQTSKDSPSRFCFCFTASTSAAAAQVSGVVALLIGSGRATSRGAIRAALLSGARDLGPRGRDPEYGAGLVQAWRALALTRPAAAAHPATPRDPGAPSRSARTVSWIVVVVGVACALAVALAVRRRRRGAT
jgi:subtilisin family serine protease